MLHDLPISAASYDDLPDVAQLHVASWKQTYVGQVPQAYLDNNDATGFFAATDDLLVPGPTLTNVNDIRAILVD